MIEHLQQAIRVASPMLLAVVSGALAMEAGIESDPHRMLGLAITSLGVLMGAIWFFVKRDLKKLETLPDEDRLKAIPNPDFYRRVGEVLDEFQAVRTLVNEAAKWRDDHRADSLNDHNSLREEYLYLRGRVDALMAVKKLAEGQ